MSVLMMAVVDVRVIMVQRDVLVLMLMPFGEMEPDSEGHQRPGDDEQRCRPLSEDCNGQQGAYERRC